MCVGIGFRDEQDPLYHRSLIDGKSAITGPRSDALMSQDWEKDLLEAGVYRAVYLLIYLLIFLFVTLFIQGALSQHGGFQRGQGCKQKLRTNRDLITVVKIFSDY